MPDNRIVDLKIGSAFSFTKGGATYIKMSGHYVCIYDGSTYQDDKTDTYVNFLGFIDLVKLDKALEEKFR